MDPAPFGRRTLGALAPAILFAPAARAQGTGAEPLAAAANELGLRLLAGQLAEPAPARIVSPLSLADACALLVPAASGPADAALRDAFRLGAGGDAMAGFRALDAALADGPALRRATALWLRMGAEPLPAYAEAIRPLRTLSRHAVDFASPEARTRINAWVAEATQGRIGSIVDRPFDPDTRAAITSALHFLGRWTDPFEPTSTRPGPFRRIGAAPVQVPFLQDTLTAGFAEDGPLIGLTLSYMEREFEFLCLAPAPKAPVDAVIEALRGGRVTEVLGRMAFRRQRVRIGLPRCQAEAAINLTEALRPTPLGPAILPGARYDGITDQPTTIGAAVQKCFLRIDESGTEAAASTFMDAPGTGRGGSQPPVFRADAPFLAAVRHRKSGIFVILALIAEPQPIA